MIDSKYLANALTERFGLALNAKDEIIQDGHRITILPDAIEHTISFKIELILGWRSIKALFKPGNFAASLIKSMNSAKPEQKQAFTVFFKSLHTKGAAIKFLINGIENDANHPENWPKNWISVSLSMVKVGVVLENNSDYDFDAAFPWATGFLGLCLALLPMEHISETEQQGETEGTSYYKLIKLYERSRINRAACIEVNGTVCKICNFSFADVYGNIGEGFIHVHHIIPVSQLGSDYVLNPEKDLIPVCPNCHAMLHRKNPPYSPEELRNCIKMGND